MQVTAKSYPYVFAAFRAIDLENGRVNRYTPQVESYEVDDPRFIALLDRSERALSELIPVDLEEFCNGERGDVEEKYLAADSDLWIADRLLCAYFDDWCELWRSDAD